MATVHSCVPYLRTVTLTTGNVVYNLYDLLTGLTDKPPGALSKTAQAVQLQFDKDAGADLLYIGNPDTLSTTDFGVMLVGTQAHTISSLDSNLIHLDNIALLSDGDGHVVYVEVITR